MFVTSTDGTKVPMFITMKKGSARDGSHPTLLTGYGFGGISLTPSFDPSMIAWMERGGAYALVNIRGGGEYGVAWHEAGRLAHQQDKLDDFNAGGGMARRERGRDARPDRFDRQPRVAASSSPRRRSSIPSSTAR